MAGGGAGGALLASNGGCPKPPAVVEPGAPAGGGIGVPVLMYGPVARDGRWGRGSMNGWLLLRETGDCALPALPGLGRSTGVSGLVP